MSLDSPAASASDLVLAPDPAVIAHLQSNLEDLTAADITRWRPGKPTGFNIVDVRPRDEQGAPIVFPMSFDYRIDPLVIARLRILSMVTHARVIGVETPGVTMDASSPARTSRSSVPWRVTLHTLRGDYRALAQMQVDAAADTLGIGLSGARLLGESLGTQSVSAMATLVPVRSLDLVEPPNAERLPLRDLPDLGRALTTLEHDRRGAMIALSTGRGWPETPAFEDSSPENATIDAALKRFTDQGRWAVASAVGLHRPLLKTLQHVPASVPITLWRARESTVCTATALDSLSESLAARGRQVRAVTMSTPTGPAGHHVLTGLSEMAAFAAALSARR